MIQSFKDKFSIKLGKGDPKTCKDKIEKIKDTWNNKNHNQSYLYYNQNHHFQNPSFPQSTVEIYERYIMAQFKFSNPNDIKKERAEAIKSLIPGTVSYYHLFFLDVLKERPLLEDFTLDELELFIKFQEQFKHYNEIQYLEIETLLRLVNPIESLPQMSETLDLESRQKYCDIITLINSKYLQNTNDNLGTIAQLEQRCSEYLKTYKRDQSDMADDQKIDVYGQLVPKKFVDPFKVDLNQERRMLVQKKKEELVKYAKEKYCQNTNSLYGYENDLDWNKYNTKYIINHAEQKPADQFYEIVCSSFFDKLAQFFNDNTKKKTYEQHTFRTTFYQKFTIEQLDKYRSSLRNTGVVGCSPDENFRFVYFAKVFSLEMSQEYQLNLTNEEKLENLKNLYAYAKSNSQPQSLKSNLLHEMLLITIKLDEYDVPLFKEYLSYPFENSGYLKRGEYDFKDKYSYNRQFYSDNSIYSCFNELFKNSQKHSQYNQYVIPKYLEYICLKNKGSLQGYKDIFIESYIKQISNKVLVYYSANGIMDMPEKFDVNEFKRIQDEVLIRFKENNKEQFKINEPVNLILEIKNVPELIIKVFQFNTVTYYKKNLKQFDTSINLEGMVPYIQRTEKEMFKDIPKNRIVTKQFDFNELKDQAGLYIIELQGNGMKSRTIIKKGLLTLVHRETAAGHICYIIDEDKNICKSQTTGVWIEKKFYKCNAEQNGQIFIPYGTYSQSHKIIMIHNNFAQLGDFQRNTEQYSFQTNFHLNSEQMLVGQEAQILIRPQLFINGRKVGVGLLQNCQVTLNIGDYIEDRTNTKTYENIQFSNNEEKIISFQVPPNMSNVNLSITAQVQNVTLKKLETFIESKSIPIQQHSTSTRISELYLRRINKLYYIYALGRNGEPQINQNISVRAKRSMKYQCEKDMNENCMTDNEGKVCIGELNEVDFVIASLTSAGISESWNISNNHIDKWTQPTQIEIIEGETVTIPVNYNESTPLQRHQVSFKMSRDNNILHNLFEKIHLVKAECGLYQLINLEGLECGDYQLELNIVAGQRKTINIIVQRGTYWERDFILKKNGLMESKVQKNAIRFEEVKIALNKNAESAMSIQLTNFSKDSRTHIFGTQFMPNITDSLQREITDSQQDQTTQKAFPFACWNNIFESNNTLGDEVRYVLDRQKKENKMGNTLDRPTYLLKPNKLQTTKVDDEKLNKDQTFQQHNLDEVATMQMKLGKQSNEYYNNQYEAPTQNIIKDYQNFLNCAPLQIFNLKPQDNGIVKVNIENIENYSQLFLIGCDSDSVVQRQIDVRSLLNKSQVPKIPRRDLTVNKEVVENEETGLMEARTTDMMQKGDNVHIEDITSSKIQIIDDLEKVYQVMKELKSMGNKIDQLSGNQEFQDLFKILLPWNTYDFKKKCALFSKHTCHELNFFLFKRDKEFYNQVVKLLIQNKLEKTFLDHYLLGIELADANNTHGKLILSYIDLSYKLDKINALEKCLLIHYCLAKGSEDQKNKARLHAKYLQMQQREEEKYDSNFTDGNLRIRMFDAVIGSGGLDGPNQASQQIQSLQKETAKKRMKKAFMRQESMEERKEYAQEEIQDACGGDYDDEDYDEEEESMPQEEEALMASASAGLFDKMDDLIQNQRKQIVNDVGFKELDQTSEYMETHYLNVKSASSQVEYYIMNRLFSDYSKYLVENEGKQEEEKLPFLSDCFMDISMMFQPFAFALIDLPLKSSSSQCSHKFKSDQGRGIEITAGSNAILFKKEIKEGRCQLKNDLMIMHRYQSLINYREDDDEVEDLVINHPYQCEIIMTNISPKTKEVTLLFQIPNGSMPLKKTKYLDSKRFDLRPYTTIKTAQQFYFPSDGSFQHAPSNFSQKQLVTCKSSLNILEIGKKRIIKNIVTFKDMMVTCQNNNERKAKILDLYKNNYQKVTDYKFEYTKSVENYFGSEDPEFYVAMLEQIRYNESYSEFWRLFSRHYQKILTDDKYKKHRLIIVKTIKDLMKNKNSYQVQYLFQFVNKPINNDLIEVHPSQLNTHLEYFPMINQRVFSLPGTGGASDESGEGTKQIMNVQFRTTYQKFLYLLLHLNFLNDTDIDFGIKPRIQLAFYLQLQDRVEEAHKVFKTIDQESRSEINLGSDYTQAYLEFFKKDDKANTNRFDQLKKIVQKYQDCPIDRFKIIFNKVKEQIDEIDEAKQMMIISSSTKKEPEIDAKKKEEIDAKQKEEIDEEQLRIARNKKKVSEPIIHDASIDEKTGTLTIESVNIDILTIKYYLIDIEILFSRSPFIQDQASQFSYVKPYKILDVQTTQGEPTNQELPEDLKGKNMVIEIVSGDLQQFKTFYSCQLKVQLIQKFGELRVFNRDTKYPLSKVYCKVYCKNRQGKENFFRDGFTDIRGKFEYANASGKSLNDVSKFSILVCDDEHKNGSTIKEVDPPEIK